MNTFGELRSACHERSPDKKSIAMALGRCIDTDPGVALNYVIGQFDYEALTITRWVQEIDAKTVHLGLTECGRKNLGLYSTWNNKPIIGQVYVGKKYIDVVEVDYQQSIRWLHERIFKAIYLFGTYRSVHDREFTEWSMRACEMILQGASTNDAIDHMDDCRRQKPIPLFNTYNTILPGAQRWIRYPFTAVDADIYFGEQGISSGFVMSTFKQFALTEPDIKRLFCPDAHYARGA